MRKLSLRQLVSLDGFILERGTELGAWWEALPDDDELDERVVASLRPAGTHVMGRATYEAMAAYWPTSPAPVAPIMNDVPKVVFSKTLEAADWPETRIARGDVGDEIAALKAEAGGEIVAHGGTSLVQALVGLGVVDEYRLYVYPAVAGGGNALFAQAGSLLPLRLVCSTAFPSGVVELVYARLA